MTVTNTGNIQADQAGSVGILAQSIGGGGGNGGFAGSLTFSSGGQATTNAVGGQGAGSGNGNTVSVTNAASIATAGSQSIGIFAQSVGGGGGNGGFSIAAGGTTQDTSSSQTVGGSGGAAGAGGDVTVQSNATANSTASITTRGDLAYGILAQSVGGGGGNGGFAIAGSVSTSAGARSGRDRRPRHRRRQCRHRHRHGGRHDRNGGRGIGRHSGAVGRWRRRQRRISQAASRSALAAMQRPTRRAAPAGSAVPATP